MRFIIVCNYGDELYHHGIKGQKWGVRRFQNEDGTLTEEGLRRRQRQEKRRESLESYNRGREISRTHDRIYEDKLDKLRFSSDEYRRNVRSRDDAKRRGNLDDNGIRTKQSSSFLDDIFKSDAEYQYRKASERMDELDVGFKKKAEEYTHKKLLKDYGDTYTKDLNHYKATNKGIAAVATIIAGIGAMVITSAYDHSKRS